MRSACCNSHTIIHKSVKFSFYFSITILKNKIFNKMKHMGYLMIVAGVLLVAAGIFTLSCNGGKT